jgi:hypothetical protein
MPFDPYNPEDMARLRRSISESKGKLKGYYNNYRLMIDTLHDPVHEQAEVDTMERVPHNPMDRGLRILTRGVVDQNPSLRVVRTERPRIAAMLKAQLMDWARQVDMASILQRGFQQAFLRWCIAYTGYESISNGYGMLPFVDVLDFDDYFIDLRGNDETDVDFEGHRWARRVWEIQNDPSYDQEVAARIAESATSRYGSHGLTLYDWVDLQCVYLPKEGIELTLTCDEYGGITEPLRVKRYVGPPSGPYVRLHFGNVPGTMIPVSRASMLYDNNELIIRGYRHLGAQADRAIEFYGYAGMMEKDAEKHRTAMDGEYLQFENPNSVVTYKKGGVNPQTLAATIHFDNLFDADAGNLKLIGGLGPSAETLGQERSLAVGVQALLDDMRHRMDAFAKQLYETAAWYILRDPFRNETVTWTTARGSKAVSKWVGAQHEGMAEDDPEMEIIPGSMVSRSPNGQLKSLIESFQIIASAMALPGAKPVIFNIEAFTKLMAEYNNQPEISDLFTTVPNAASVVPGVEGAAQLAPRPSRSPAGNGQAQPNKMVERLIYSGGQPQPGA